LKYLGALLLKYLPANPGIGPFESTITKGRRRAVKSRPIGRESCPTAVYDDAEMSLIPLKPSGSPPEWGSPIHPLP
jgi:hypothetical protein